MNTTRNRSIDLMKFIFSICIIAIHAQVFLNTNLMLYQTIVMGLMRIAVPFFFIAAGYFYYQRITLKQETKPYIMKLVQLFLIFETIEIVFYLLPALGYIEPQAILSYLWTALTIGLGRAYWFLTSLILSLIIVTWFWKKEKVNTFLIIGFLLYLSVFTIDSYAGFFEGTMIQKGLAFHTAIWTWPQAGLTSSLFYLSIGAWIYQKKPILKHIFFYLSLALVALFFEAYFLQTHGAIDGNCYVSLMICTPLLFMACLQYPHIPFDTARIGKMSLYIYMVHPFVLSMIRVCAMLSNEMLFVIATPITIGIAYLLTKPRIIS